MYSVEWHNGFIRQYEDDAIEIDEAGIYIVNARKENGDVKRATLYPWHRITEVTRYDIED